jgi:hypothetical protein
VILNGWPGKGKWQAFTNPCFSLSQKNSTLVEKLSRSAELLKSALALSQNVGELCGIRLTKP